MQAVWQMSWKTNRQTWCFQGFSPLLGFDYKTGPGSWLDSPRGCGAPVQQGQTSFCSASQSLGLPSNFPSVIGLRTDVVLLGFEE